eukprot:SAG11_NODE_4574_length_1845_cov_11.295533_2_plen_491_part_00
MELDLDGDMGDESEEEEEEGFSFEQICALQHEFQYSLYNDRSPAISAIVSEEPMTDDLLQKLGYCTVTAKVTVNLRNQSHIIQGTNKLAKDCFFVDIESSNAVHIVSLIDRYPQLFRNMNRSCTIKVPGNPEWNYPVYKIIGQHSGPGTVIKEARRSPRNTGGSTDTGVPTEAGGNPDTGVSTPTVGIKWTGTPDEFRKLSFGEWKQLGPTYCPSRDSVKTFIKMITGWGKDIQPQLFAELMVRRDFNQHIRMFHCPQLDGISRTPLSEEIMAKWDIRYDPDFIIDPSQVFVPVSYTDMRKLVTKARKTRIPISLYFTCDWMPGPRAMSEGGSTWVLQDPHLREYKGYTVFNGGIIKKILKALEKAHDNKNKIFQEQIKKEEEAREKKLRAERAAEREAARIAAEEAEAARAAAREASRIQAEEDAAKQEEDSPTPTPTLGDGSIAPEQHVDEPVTDWVLNPDTGKTVRCEVDSPLYNKLKKMQRKKRRR